MEGVKRAWSMNSLSAVIEEHLKDSISIILKRLCFLLGLNCPIPASQNAVYARPNILGLVVRTIFQIFWIVVILIGAYLDRIRLTDFPNRDSFFRNIYYAELKELTESGVFIDTGTYTNLTPGEIFGETLDFVFFFNTILGSMASLFMMTIQIIETWMTTNQNYLDKLVKENTGKHGSLYKTDIIILVILILGIFAAGVFSVFLTYQFFENIWEFPFMSIFWLHPSLASLLLSLSFARTYIAYASEYMEITKSRSPGTFGVAYTEMNRKVARFQVHHGALILILMIFVTTAIVTQVYGIVDLLANTSAHGRKDLATVEASLIFSLFLTLIAISVGGEKLKRASERAGEVALDMWITDSVKFQRQKGSKTMVSITESSEKSPARTDWKAEGTHPSLMHNVSNDDFIKLRLIVMEKPLLDVMGFFEIGMASMGSAIISIITYVMILTQFKSTENLDDTPFTDTIPKILGE
ncbi:unnamed protein product [Cyprideis torosa]|uniref:Uncharacterized protein n=1 Tax=Cyprideis torosa TaxID=163714 RepID=A0A7R8ZMD7_9CRUS|nr:unnamed protein product [Cyprideis torosa]CAG0888600.1 unnamed protein product [Cyprideis torosa]